MRRLLWIGDAVAATGFARCTHGALDVLRQSWEVHCLGINYDGDPHPWPYSIYPASRSSRPEDAFGCVRSRELVARLKPDLVVILQDPWNIPRYVELIRKVDANVPIVGWIAVDGKNCRGTDMSGLAKAIFWTRYGEEQARLGGYEGPTAVVPLGADLERFSPRSRVEAREQLGLPAHARDAFIVGSVGRNQVRKRLDLTLDYFAYWLHTENPNAYLLLHVAPTGEQGFDLKQLGTFHGLTGRMLISSPNFYHGIQDADMAWVYSAMDVYWSTTQGEGWGLTALEAMACGVPCVLPDWAAYGEWARESAYMVPCTEVAYTPVINAQGGIVDRRMSVQALNRMYRDVDLRLHHRRKGLELARASRYRWADIGAAFAREVDGFAVEEAA